MTVPAQIQDLETKYTKKWKQAPLEVRTNIGDLLHAIYQVAVSSHIPWSLERVKTTLLFGFCWSIPDVSVSLSHF